MLLKDFIQMKNDCWISCDVTKSHVSFSAVARQPEKDLPISSVIGPVITENPQRLHNMETSQLCYS